VLILVMVLVLERMYLMRRLTDKSGQPDMQWQVEASALTLCCVGCICMCVLFAGMFFLQPTPSTPVCRQQPSANHSCWCLYRKTLGAMVLNSQYENDDTDPAYDTLASGITAEDVHNYLQANTSKVIVVNLQVSISRCICIPVCCFMPCCITFCAWWLLLCTT